MPPDRFEVLYCGDTALDNAACYLAGLLTRAGRTFRYVPSDQPIGRDLLETAWDVVIFSDYPAARLSEGDHQHIIDRVRDGAGLLMLGGWESFHGLGGDWQNTPVARILPVEIAAADDRFNCDRPLVARQCGDHPITEGLPWETRPPLIGGLNRVMARPFAKILLAAEQWDLRREAEDLVMSRASSHVLLAVGESGAGRTAAFASDVAPHWIGPMVDWGLPRVECGAEGAPAIEVGAHYAEFFTRLVAWTAGWIQ
jgi:hypothetical protein